MPSHDCSVADMPLRVKKMAGGGRLRHNGLIKMGNLRKKSVELKIKLSERREHCVYFYLYKSKYSTPRDSTINFLI